MEPGIDYMTLETFVIQLTEIIRSATLLGSNPATRLVINTPQNTPGGTIVDWELDRPNNVITIWMGR